MLGYDLLRTVHFRPYRKGMGPTFTLKTFDTGQTDHYGKFRIAYQLIMRGAGKRSIVFEGADFCTPQAIDSDETIEGLMKFLTLRPGDTDDEYFRGYTPEQMAYCESHAESLGYAVHCRFNCQNCGNFAGNRTRLCDGCKASKFRG